MTSSVAGLAQIIQSFSLFFQSLLGGDVAGRFDIENDVETRISTTTKYKSTNLLFSRLLGYRFTKLSVLDTTVQGEARYLEYKS